MVSDMYRLLITLAFFYLLQISHARSAEVYWTLGGSNEGPTPQAAAELYCSGYQYCAGYTIDTYLYDPSRADLLTITFFLADGTSVWTSETAHMQSCVAGQTCSFFNYETGATVCSDGYYSDAANNFGYINTCDRPDIKQCDDGSFQLQNGFCPIALPVCSDALTCETYAQTQLDCSNATNITFTYIDPDNWDYTCERIDPEEPELFGCNTEYCGGIGHVSADTDTGDTGTGDNGGGDTDTGNGDTGDTGTGNSGGGDTGSGDIGSGGNGTGTGVGSGTGTGSGSSDSNSGPCDPSQPDYYQCLDTPLGNLPVHSQSDASTFDEANANFKARLDGAPVVQAFSGMADIVNVDAGQCPEFSIDFPSPINTTASTDIHCTLMTTIAPVLSAVMIVVYIWVAFRIFASA